MQTDLAGESSSSSWMRYSQQFLGAAPTTSEQGQKEQQLLGHFLIFKNAIMGLYTTR